MALQVLLILVALALFWGRAIASPQPMPEGDAILYNLLSKTLTHTPLPAVIIAMLLVLAEGILLNLVLASAALVPQTSLLPTLLYITAASATATTLTPALLINAILIACLHRLMIHGTPLTLPTSRICSVAALIGLASMISLPATAFLLTYLLVAINYRLYGWRDWTAMLLGFAAPYIALVIMLLFTGDLSSWWSLHRPDNHTQTRGEHRADKHHAHSSLCDDFPIERKNSHIPKKCHFGNTVRFWRHRGTPVHPDVANRAGPLRHTIRPVRFKHDVTHTANHDRTQKTPHMGQ